MRRGAGCMMAGMRAGMTTSRVEQWERRTDVPLLLLATAFLVAYVWPVLDPEIDPTARTFLDAVSWTVWGAFAIDFTIRIWLADRRWSYVLHHWYDVLLVVIPLLRPIRLLRLLAFVRILNRTATGSLAGRATTYVVGTAVVAVALGAVAVLDVERGDPDANITTFGDALWWATHHGHDRRLRRPVPGHVGRPRDRRGV